MAPSKKASQVYEEAHFPFGERVTFHEKYRSVKSGKVTVTERGKGVKPVEGETLYYDLPRGWPYVDCSFARCFNGGVHIEAIIDKMIKRHETTYSSSHFCQGYEGSRNGKRRDQSCISQFKVKVELEYKEE